MKKLIPIFFLFFAIKGMAQYPIRQNIGSDSTLVSVGINFNGAFKGFPIVQSISDTATANTRRVSQYAYSLIAVSDTIWMRNSTATAWVKIGAGGGGSGNTLSNVGAGAQLVKALSAGNYPIRTIAQDFGIVVTQNTNDITVAVDTTQLRDTLNISNAGASGLNILYATSNTSTNKTIFGKKLLASTGITTVQNTDSSISFLNNLSTGVSGGQSVIGSTSPNSGLTIKATTGVGTTGSNIIFQVGNNGATEVGRMFSSGNFALGTTSDNGNRFRVNGSVEFDLGGDAPYDMWYRDSSGTFTIVPKGSAGEVMTAGTDGLPGWAAPTGAADGDYGDIIVSGSGTIWTIDDGVVSTAKLDASGSPDPTTFLTVDGGGNLTWATPVTSAALDQFNVGVGNGSNVMGTTSNLTMQSNVLKVASTNTVGDFVITNTAGLGQFTMEYNSDLLTLSTAGTLAMSITGTQQVLIGTSSAAAGYQLLVSNSTAANGRIQQTGDVLFINSAAASTYLRMADADNTGFFLEYTGKNSLISLDAVQKYQFTNFGGTSNFVKVGGTANVNTTAVGNVGGGEDNLMQFTIPASTMSVNGSHIEFRMVVTSAANTNSKTIKVYYGSTVYTIPAFITSGTITTITGTVTRTGATSQIFEVTASGDNGTIQTIYTNTQTAAETLSGAVTLKLTGTATSNDDLLQTLMIVKYYPY